jgi:hypothetical protein
MNSGIFFILNHIDVKGDLPLQMIPDHTFRKARKNEIEEIEKLISISQPRDYRFNSALYRSMVIREGDANRTSYSFEELPESDWKYWVIAFEGWNEKLHEIEKCALLLDPDLDFGFQIIFEYEYQAGKVAAHTYMPIHLVEKYNSREYHTANAKEITTSELKKISRFYEMSHNINPRYAYINHALENFLSIRRIPARSELLIVGYFSIIETLITHAPRLTETLDSIGHQIRNKVVLLRKQFSRHIAYDLYFKDASEQKVWQKLYSYRSCLAHGSIPDFSGEFQILVDNRTILEFLKENIKELFKLALNDPEFMTDLKKC